MDRRSAEVRFLQGRHQLGEIQLLVDLDEQVVGVNEIAKLLGGELEQSGVSAATVQWLEHHFSLPATDCSYILAQKAPRTPNSSTFFNTPYQ